MTQSESKRELDCLFEQYTPAWELGTGLRVSLPPGSYRVTGEEMLDGSRYVRLNEVYRVNVRDIANMTKQTKSLH